MTHIIDVTSLQNRLDIRTRDINNDIINREVNKYIGYEYTDISLVTSTFSL
jgi:hypothetical protein